MTQLGAPPVALSETINGTTYRFRTLDEREKGEFFLVAGAGAQSAKPMLTASAMLELLDRVVTGWENMRDHERELLTVGAYGVALVQALNILENAVGRIVWPNPEIVLIALIPRVRQVGDLQITLKQRLLQFESYCNV